jgi:hypothetical protein
LAMDIHEFSTRVERMNPEPMPVMRPLCSVSPVESSLEVSPTKLAIFFPLPKRERSSPSSRTNLIAVNQPILRETAGDGKSFVVALLVAELSEGSS